MLWLRKSKKGFTLIELMVVVATIGILALMGLRLYSGQQDRAKNAIVKANVGTIQTQLQSELADTTFDTIKESTYLNNVIQKANIFNPWGIGTTDVTDDNGQQIKNPNNFSGTAKGEVYVYVNESDVQFEVSGKGSDEENVYGAANPLIARP